ncbi:hypothetical protein MT325_m380L [Paramecium bursaria chlorella virus MT325]|uniref:Uncharacterized protein m380L n=1 Tax=Paramecium bursaria Chlorella virus MT325 TaxID=346932 RepID=A7IUB0_PBCVM|nr:hypothetical protein MT325_m380L [Paramecium bursaria chlorella virus MT325]
MPPSLYVKRKFIMLSCQNYLVFAVKECGYTITWISTVLGVIRSTVPEELFANVFLIKFAHLEHNVMFGF